MAIQLQDFAKQVLFGTTIEEKLSFPREEIIDTRPGDPINTPRNLPRPAQLSLRPDGVKASHPSVAKLVYERERGKLLHFFGNHELLATELMALALLKFPDAPKSFRQGLLETLKDEQIHTRIYIHRMKQCGIEFGELPLSDYFWKSVSTMQDPLDYVTRLSLTFEQANLDYSREYGKRFQELGDTATAAILDKIYRDEIGHVGFGLRWFRQWKAAGKSDWETFRERLVFPLSPARAKGNDFNEKGRQEAGLDEDFTTQLRLFNQSRGRTPVVHWFNPEAEKWAGANKSPELDQPISPLQSDLAFLPAYLSRKGDVLCLPQAPQQVFLEKLHRAGFSLPEILVYPNTGKHVPLATLERKLGSLRPWAWSPDSVDFFQNAYRSLTRTVSLDTLWNDARRKLFSKAWSADWGRGLCQDCNIEGWLAPEEIFGQSIREIGELNSILERLRKLGYSEVACKAPFSTAASGMRRLRIGEPMPSSIEEWMSDVLQEQGELVVEPWLERVFDFSIQCERSDDGTKVVAYTRLLNNPRGQFSGILCNAFNHGIPPEVRRLLFHRIDSKPRLYQWYENQLLPRLEPVLDAAHFKGAFGIDAFVYRDSRGDFRLKPLVEINPRATMGRIAHELSAHLHPRSVGLFQILSRSQIKKRGVSQLSEYASQLEARNPWTLEATSKPFVKSGSLALNDPSTAQQFLALFHAAESIKELEPYLP